MIGWIKMTKKVTILESEKHHFSDFEELFRVDSEKIVYLKDENGNENANNTRIEKMVLLTGYGTGLFRKDGDSWSWR